MCWHWLPTVPVQVHPMLENLHQDFRLDTRLFANLSGTTGASPMGARHSGQVLEPAAFQSSRQPEQKTWPQVVRTGFLKMPMWIEHRRLGSGSDSRQSASWQDIVSVAAWIRAEQSLALPEQNRQPSSPQAPATEMQYLTGHPQQNRQRSFPQACDIVSRLDVTSYCLFRLFLRSVQVVNKVFVCNEYSYITIFTHVRSYPAETTASHPHSEVK
jgi:hypothetical protein